MNAPATAAQTAPDIDVRALNVYQRINEIRKSCPYIKKNKEVTGGGTYMAVTHDHVTAELRPYLVEQGIVIVPRLLSSVVADTGTFTKNQIPIIRYEARYEVDFVNMDNPTDRVTVPIESHALDSGDKAPGKAASYATKYAMLKLFSIETGEHEEDRLDAKGAGKKDLPGKITATDDALERLTAERREVINQALSSIVDCFEAGQEQEAFKAYTEVTDQDERVALWHLLKPHSKMRRRLKDMAEAAWLAAGHKPAERDPNAHRRD
jgi:hypothetical protein